MNTCFINEALDYGIKKYIENKKNPEGLEFNSFLVVVIRQLCCIYDELDIINPYLVKKEDEFKENIQKYGYSSLSMEQFFNEVQRFYDLTKNGLKAIPYIISVQKKIIDMYILRKQFIGTTEEKNEQFYKLLYNLDSNNVFMKSTDYLDTLNSKEIILYYKEKNSESQKKIESDKPKVLINLEAYKLFGLDSEEVSKKSSEELELINNQIYEYFNINKNAINKDYLLDQAIEHYYKEQFKITSGNGYVDILLIMGIISTLIMGVSVIKFLLS